MAQTIRTILLLLAALALVTCGSGSGAGGGGLDYGEHPVPRGPGDPPPGTPPPGTPPPPDELAGGVLATFTSGGEQFSVWISGSGPAQRVLDAWQGTAPPITALCADLQPGPGKGQHNAPWSWSVNPALPINFTGLCLGCALGWSTPSLAEAGMVNGPPYNCDDSHGGARAMVFMQVTLVGASDHR